MEEKWNIPNTYEFVSTDKPYIVQSIGNHDKESFSGVVIKSANPEIKVGKYSDLFSKRQFKPVTVDIWKKP